MQLRNVRFLNGGYCWQNCYFSGIPSVRFRRFQAVFIYFEHPLHGGCLIDTGYGPQVIQATRHFPWRLLRWLTPIPKRQDFATPNYLASQQIDPNRIENVFVSHFHADHIGGTRFFPDSKFVYRAQSLAQLAELSGWNQLQAGFIPALLPDDFVERGQPISESQFTTDQNGWENLRTLDYWGDGSLILIDLPGHAIGHTGFLLNTTDAPRLYVVDAFWDLRAFKCQSRLPWLSRRILHSYDQYQQTNKQLLELTKRHELSPLACHCPATQDLV